MRQPVQFARRQPTLPVVSTTPAAPRQQMDFSRPVSRAGSVGFAFLSLTLATMTFVVTIWGVELPAALQLDEPLSFSATAAVAKVPAPVPATDAEFVYEPKTTARLPVFGGFTVTER